MTLLRKLSSTLSASMLSASLHAGRCALVAAYMLPAILLALAPAVSAQSTLITLYAFHGGLTDGAFPYSPIAQDSAGNLYGTAAGGGTSNAGVVFKIDTFGNESIVYNFTGGKDGGNPRSGLFIDAVGNLYGITGGGGVGGHGVIFKLSQSGRETVLHTLTSTDGSGSASGLIRDSAGNFYGTTEIGGAHNLGVAFKLDPLNNYTVLHNFGSAHGSDGSEPFAGLVRDSAGNLYGTTFEGGRFGEGTVFKIDSSANESVLYNFAGGTDGDFPSSRLVLDSAGNLYGTTDGGGANGSGTVFKVSPGGAEKILHSFGGTNDGASPFVGLVKDSSGNFYGVTDGGGAFGHGSVFKIDKFGNESVLYSFTGGDDGARPEAALFRDAAGNMYGTTLDQGAHRQGTVFELTFP